MHRRRCPRCVHTALEACEYHGHEVDVCRRCGGLWGQPSTYDIKRLSPLPSAGEAARPDDVLLTAGGSDPVPGVHVTPRSRLCCPNCHRSLTALQVGGADGCEIDQCISCGGAWFDHGEWEHVRALQTIAEQQEDLDRPTTWGEWAFQFFLGLPIEFNVRPHAFPGMTLFLMGACLLVGLWQMAVGEEVWLHYALFPAEVWAGHGLFGILASLFLHAGAVHFLGNMYFLYTFGDNVEDVLGPWRFLALYMACGLVSGLLIVLGNPDGVIPTVGASGAIAGIMAAYLLLYRQARLTFMLIFWQFKMPAWAWLGGWFVLQLFGAWMDRGGEASGVAWLGHIGGFMAGLLLIWPWEDSLLRKNPLLRLLRTRRQSSDTAHHHEPRPSTLRLR